MKITEQQLRDIKSLGIEMFGHFTNACDKLGLRYYLVAGTLLGAVRHKGFIPWDDDIDVGMPREDYERFIAEGQKYMPDGFFIQAIQTESDYLANFAKIRNSNTTFIEKSVKNRNINHGVYLDIFPLDLYPETEKAQKHFHILDKIYSRRIAAEYCVEENGIKRRIVSAILKLVYPSVKTVVEKREALITSLKKSDRCANFSGIYGTREVMPIEWYGDGVVLEFEGIEAIAPREYDKWLTQVYGDYMQLPSEDKRVPHHSVSIIDFEKPYTYYTEK